MVDEVKQTNLNPVVFSAKFLLNVTLCYHGTTFLLLTSVRCFLKFSCPHCGCWEYKFTLNVWLQSKNSKWIMTRWSYYTHSINFLPWNSTFGVGCRNSFLSIHCLLQWKLSWNIHFSSPVMIFLRNKSFLCLERRLVTIDMQSSLFFSLGVWGTQTPSLLTFLILIKVRKSSWCGFISH